MKIVTATTKSDGMPADTDKQKQAKFIARAMERWRGAADVESQNRVDSLDDIEFSLGKQWPDEIETRRVREGKPCLKMNRMGQFISQVANEQRQQRPAVQVNPVGAGATKETAEVLQGIIRHIEVQSDAEVAYDTAFDFMLRGGIAWIQVFTDYADDETFDQEIFVEAIPNPFTVYDDPAAKKHDRSDSKWRFIIEDVPREEYKSRYPKSALATMDDFSSIGDKSSEWISKECIRIAQYWHIEEDKQTILQLEDGSIMPEDEYKKAYPDDEEPPSAAVAAVSPETPQSSSGAGTAEAPSGEDEAAGSAVRPKIVNRRDKVVPKVVCSLINATEILEEQSWPGRYLPQIPVFGRNINVNGKRHIAGLVRDAKDPQRQYNYMCSAATASVGIAPLAPWLIAEGQIEGHEEEWRTQNVNQMPVLVYKSVDIGGKPVDKPERIVAEPPIQAMAYMLRQASDDLKATTGIYDASLGNAGPEQSGKAILARQKQSDVTNLSYTDNLSRAIRHLGRIWVDLIPHIYDSPRIMRIINPDTTVDHVGIFNSVKSEMGIEEVKALPDMQDVKKIYDIGVGKYDVTVAVGPSYQSKRQEAVQSIMALVQAYPQVMQAAGDILVRNMDWPGADAIADRLKKLLPPVLQDEGDDPEQQAMKLQSQLQALSQQHGTLVQLLNQANEIIKTKQVEQQSKVQIAALQEETKRWMVKMQEATKLAVAQMNSSKDANQAFAEKELEQYKIMHEGAHDVAMAHLEHSHAMELGQQQADNAQAAQAAAQQLSDQQSQGPAQAQ